MNEFQSIMGLMNNGIHNDSTLKDSIPAIVKYTSRFGADKAYEALEWVPKEEALQPKAGHEGLDEVVSICMEAVASMQMEQSRIR